jgi:hypothetical protein
MTLGAVAGGGNMAPSRATVVHVAAPRTTGPMLRPSLHEIGVDSDLSAATIPLLLASTTKTKHRRLFPTLIP